MTLVDVPGLPDICAQLPAERADALLHDIGAVLQADVKTAGRLSDTSFGAISDPNNTTGNVVTTAPVIVNLGEARVSVPFKGMKLDIAARVQDDQPRPAHGATGAIEAGLTVNF